MTESSIRAMGRSRGMGFAKLGLGLSVLCVALVIATVLAYRGGTLSVRDAFGYIEWIVYGGMAATLVSLGGLFQALRAKRVAATTMAGLGIVVALLIVWVPYSNRVALRASPRLSDITTDTRNPPAFVKTAALRRSTKARNPMTYVQAKAKLQKSHYPDIKPVLVALPPDRAFARALAVVEKFGLTLVASDKAAGRIEAFDTSLIFGFIDDVVIRVKADGAGSRIDIRSSSRVGRRDAAVNANRVRKLMAALSGP